MKLVESIYRSQYLIKKAQGQIRPSKYKEGDYITPTDPSWSWHGQVAYVQKVLDKGTPNNNSIRIYEYSLVFFDPKSRIWIKPGRFSSYGLEAKTQKTLRPS